MLYIGDTLNQLERQLSVAMSEQLPFAMARALNDTAEDVLDIWRDTLERSVDRPTPFTLRGPTLVRWASKRSLTAIAGVRNIQEDYLSINVFGGTRTPRGAAILVPVNARTNRYGNMPRNYVRNLLNSGRAFVASRSDARTAHLAPGIYERRKVRGVVQPPRLLVAFEDAASYRPGIDLEGTARLRARNRFPDHLSRRLREAWATRRR